MSKRGNRGGGAALYAARQTTPITVQQDEPGDEGDEVLVVDEAGEILVDEPQHQDEPDEGDDEPQDDEPDEALTTMQRQLAALQARNAELENQVNVTEQDVVVSQQAVLNQALAGAKQRAIDAESEIAVASAAGDHIAIAKATAKLAKAIQDQDRYELAADELTAELEERKVGRKKPAAQQQQEQPAANGDAYVTSLSKFSAPSREWLLKHRDKIEGNVKVGTKAQALAQIAIADGIAEDSPEFFAYLEKGLGFTTMPTKSKKPAARPHTAAPSGARAGSGKPNEIVLTAAQRQAALQMGLSLKEYATNLQEIRKNGQDPNRPGLRLSADTAHSSRR